MPVALRVPRDGRPRTVRPIPRTLSSRPSCSVARWLRGVVKQGLLFDFGCECALQAACGRSVETAECQLELASVIGRVSREYPSPAHNRTLNLDWRSIAPNRSCAPARPSAHAPLRTRPAGPEGCTRRQMSVGSWQLSWCYTLPLIYGCSC
mgnify:CR=1 FL=1